MLSQGRVSIREILYLSLFFPERKLIKYTLRSQHNSEYFWDGQFFFHSECETNVLPAVCFEPSSTWYVLLCCNNMHKLQGQEERKSVFKNISMSSFKYSLFVPNIDFSFIELSKLVKRPMPLLSLAESTKMQAYIPY